MIGYLKGRVLLRDRGLLVVDVKGVGYEVMVTTKILKKARDGSNLALFIYTHVREDKLALYGFGDLSEKKLFESLLSVSGIGPKSALGVLAVGEVSAIIEAIKAGDVEFFTKVSGIGKKGAQKLIVDLRTKVGADQDMDLSESEDGAEVMMALVALGFTKREALGALKKVDTSKRIEEQIKEALKNV